MNFGFNDEQELLRSTARKFFENEVGSDTVRRLMETPEGMSPELWAKLAEQGPYVVKLPREPGKRESRYAHLFSGEVDLQALAEAVGASLIVFASWRTW